MTSSLYHARAAFALLLLAGIAEAGAAQDTRNESAPVTIGPPALRDFRLPEDRRPTQPAEPVPDIAPLPAPPPSAAPPVRIAPPPPPAASQPSSPAPRETQTAPQSLTPARPPATQSAPASPPTAPAPSADNAPVAQALPPPVRSTPAPMPVPTVPPPAATMEAAAAEGGIPAWSYLLFALLAAGIGFLLYRRRQAREDAFAAAAPIPTPRPLTPRGQPVKAPPAPAPASPSAPIPPPPSPQPAPVASGLISVSAPRPQLEIAFRPIRAAATAQQTEIQFELVVLNSGRIEARAVEIQARMFNAADEAEIARFLGAGPQPGANPGLVIPPGLEARAQSAVAMPMQQVQPIRLPDRSLFVPLVAFNVHYMWAEGRRGQTSRTFLVGRESDPPGEKMGAFRLDLGPRIYRTIGQRKADAELVR